MVDILIKGGPVMIPLLLCSVLALAISFERIYYLLRNSSDPDSAVEAVTLALEDGRLSDTVGRLAKVRGPLSALATVGLSYYGKSRGDLERALEFAGEQEIHKMERYVPWLGMIVSIAPLLGILGTITGLMKCYGVIAKNPVLLEVGALSAGIAEALITTAAGLIIAVPSLFLYTYITGIIDRRTAEMNAFCQKLLDVFSASVREVASSEFQAKGKQAATH